MSQSNVFPDILPSLGDKRFQATLFNVLLQVTFLEAVSVLGRNNSEEIKGFIDARFVLASFHSVDEDLHFRLKVTVDTRAVELSICVESLSLL